MTLDAIVKLQKDYFSANLTKDIQFRKDNLEKLAESIEEFEAAIYDALKKDLGKSKQEAYITEVGLVKREISNQIKNIEKWTREKRVLSPFIMFNTRNYIKKEPYGVVLVMSPWNNPFYLTMMPLIGAMAAGNCVILKCSKKSENTTRVISAIINSTFDKKYICMVDNNLSYDEILYQKYDYIFFTGSERVGKNVMRAAATNLIPLTLELGGKCPCIIHETADLDLAAKSVIWGKVINAGQTSVAPDYVLIPRRCKEEFIEKCEEYIKLFVGDAFNNKDYPRIINLHHFMRLTKYIMGENGLIGGRYDDDKKIIEPTIFPDATFSSNIMKEEIFGPLLPVVTYSDIDDVFMELRTREKPLACYVFSHDEEFNREVEDNIDCGTCVINDVMIQMLNERLPFGGVGASGMGRYHGKASVDCFSYEKIIVKSSRGLTSALRFPPFSEKGFEDVAKLIK